MAKKKSMDYFDTFVAQIGYSCQAATALHGILTDFKPETLADRIEEVHGIEHQADDEKHIMIRKLAKEFITPLEREDIMEMAHQIDNVTDSIEDVALQLYMFNIQTIRKEALEMMHIIIRCCDSLRQALEEFHNFRKSQILHDLVVEVNRMEEEGDQVFTKAMHNLYSSGNDVMEILGWTKIFERMEKCCDVCENVSDVIESVIMKNS